jgi:NAD+ kinase
MLISIGGDGTILRATLIRDSGIPILGINAEDGVLATVQKKTSMNFYKLLSKKNIRFLKNIIELLRPCNEALQDINFAMNEISVSRKDTT